MDTSSVERAGGESAPVTLIGSSLSPRKREVIPSELRRAVWRRDDYTCRRCASKKNLSIDHIVARSRGGPTTLENLQTLCVQCNSRKNVKSPEQEEAQSRDAELRMMTIPELATFLKVHPKAIRRWLQAGAPAVNIGSSTRPDWRFVWKEVREWLDAGKPQKKEDT